MIAMENFELNIGRACNSRCVFCMSRKASKVEKAWLPLEKAKREIRLARKRGCGSLGFLGGEPTAYPHLEAVVRYGRELGYERVALATNALKLSDGDFLDRLLDAGVTRVGVSIHSDQTEIEDQLTRVAGAFARKRQALEHLVAAREQGRLPDNVSVNPLLHKRILDRLAELVGFFQRLGIDDVRFNSYRPVDQGEHDRALCPRLSDAVPALVGLIHENEQRLDAHLTFGDIPYCVWPWTFLANPYLLRRYVGEHYDLTTSVAIFADGRSEHPQQDGLARFNWAEAKRAHLKVKAPACETCAWDAICEGFWKEYIDLYSAAELKPPVGVRPP